MRVAHVIWGRCNPESSNGVDKSVYFLSRNQAALGANVGVFSITDKDPLAIPDVEIYTFPPGRQSGVAFRLPVAPRRLVRDLLAWNPDVVNIHSVHIGAFIGLGHLLRRRGIPYVVTPHGALAPSRLQGGRWAVKAYLRMVERGYLANAKFIHAVGWTDVAGAKSLGLPVRVVTIPTGVDFASIPPTLDFYCLQREFPSLRGCRVLVFLGRLDPLQKGLDILLDGLAQSSAEGLALVLIGPDFRGSTRVIQEQVERLRLRDRVFLLGPARGPMKWSYLAAGDVFVHTSRWEGSPISVLEAMAVGLPVLVTAAADPVGAIAERGAGMIVEPTPEGVAQGLCQVSALSTSSLREMGLRAKRLAAGFDWRAIAGELLKAYGE